MSPWVRSTVSFGSSLSLTSESSVGSCSVRSSFRITIGCTCPGCRPPRGWSVSQRIHSTGWLVVLPFVISATLVHPVTSGILRGVSLSIVGSAHAGISSSVRSYVCFGSCLSAEGLVSGGALSTPSIVSNVSFCTCLSVPGSLRTGGCLSASAAGSYSNSLRCSWSIVSKSITTVFARGDNCFVLNIWLPGYVFAFVWIAQWLWHICGFSSADLKFQIATEPTISL